MTNDYYAPTPFDPVQICERIDGMLSALGWSWADLEKKSGASEAMLRSWRSGEVVPPVCAVRGVVEALGVLYEEITYGLEPRRG